MQMVTNTAYLNNISEYLKPTTNYSQDWQIQLTVCTVYQAYGSDWCLGNIRGIWDRIIKGKNCRFTSVVFRLQLLVKRRMKYCEFCYMSFYLRDKFTRRANLASVSKRDACSIRPSTAQPSNYAGKFDLKPEQSSP